MDTILFITDGSILNPILHTQGLPLLNYVADKGYKALLLSREKDFPTPKEQKLIESIKARFSKVNFIHSFEKVNHRRNWLINLYSDLKVIKKVFSSERVDIVHCRSLIPGILGLCIKLIKRDKIKLIYDNRGLRILEEIEKGHWKEKSIKVRLLLFLEKELIKFANRIIVVSQNFKSYLITNYEELELEKKIRVIPNRTIIKNDFNLAKISRSSDTILGVYTGSAVKWQLADDFHELLKAAVKVFTDINFIILTYHVGEFEKVFLNHPELKTRVIIKEVRQEEVTEELIGCNFGIMIRMKGLMSQVSSPLKFAEYISAGLPVLISEGVGDFVKIVDEHRIGVEIKDKDYLKALIEMKNLLQDPYVYHRCRRLAEKDYNIETSFTQYLETYQKLLENE